MATQWTAGLSDNTVLPASTLNTIGAAWETWTPTWTNLTVGNGTQAFYYARLQKIVFVQGVLTFGTTTSVTGTPIKVNLPITAARANFIVHVYLEDTGINLFPGVGYPVSATTIDLYTIRTDGVYATAPATSSTAPFTWGNTDKIWLSYFYEAA